VRLILKLTAAAMVLAAFSPLAAGKAELPPGGSFIDDDLTIHEGSIEAIASAGITLGCNPPRNTQFCPHEPVTRGQMAAFLVRALRLPATDPTGFSDTVGSTFAADIDRIAGAGITLGCNPPANDRYCPDRPVSRGQMAAFLTRALGLPAPGAADTFVDDDRTTFEADIERLRAAGITLGCNPPTNDRFCPGLSVTRAQMATFLARALDLDPVTVPTRPITLDVISREEWGAAPPRGEFTSHEIERITIHHAGDLNGTTGPTQFLGWQSWHHYLGWPDLAYHFIVGRDGKVYEGRPFGAVGDTATEYDPTGHFLIVVEGNFDDIAPTEVQLETLAQMMAWASMQFDVPVAAATGHRDHAATTCPGDNLYAAIHDGSLSARAAAIITAGGVTLSLAP
jgi:hypothetical protein